MCKKSKTAKTSSTCLTSTNYSETKNNTKNSFYSPTNNNSVKNLNILSNETERLTNFRGENKHMTQMPKQTDKPDILLGLGEYKEVNQPKRFHNVKKLKSSHTVPDLPDTLSPITDNQFKQMPRPESMTNVRKSLNVESQNPD